MIGDRARVLKLAGLALEYHYPPAKRAADSDLAAFRRDPDFVSLLKRARSVR